MDTKLLAKICTVLGYNFFEHLISESDILEQGSASKMPKVKLLIELNESQQGKLLELVLGAEQLAALEGL